ncbi:MAG: class I SAM-dependent methyltransferase [Hyphomicrobiaceae bacterium]
MPDWDKAYREADTALFGEEPTDFVRAVTTRPDFRCRTALCLADGDGRNGRWLARRGLRVTAVDVSAVATEIAEAKDGAAGLDIQRIVADLADWEPGRNDRWDAVFVIFLQCEATVRSRAVRRACTALNIGGWLVAEGFARGGPATCTLGPKQPDLLYDLDELRSASGDLVPIESSTGVVLLNEGIRHLGYGHIAQYCALRPATSDV